LLYPPEPVKEIRAKASRCRKNKLDSGNTSGKLA
jgi:hypothetical protein